MFMLANGRDRCSRRCRAPRRDRPARATVELRAFDAPCLADIRKYALVAAKRFQHDDPTVPDGVLAAIQLEAVANAEGHLASPKDAHEKAYKAAGMGANFDWCGFFAMENYMHSNLDSDLKRGFFHVTNVEHYFTYHYAFGPLQDTRVMKWIYAEDEWHDLRDYHTGRGSVRTWIDAAEIVAGGTLDIRPGDIVLIDNSRDAAADHIVMVHSYDMATNTLHTIGGNDGGYEVDTGTDAQGAEGESGEAGQARAIEAATGQPLRSAGGGHTVAVNSSTTSTTPDPRRPRARRACASTASAAPRSSTSRTTATTARSRASTRPARPSPASRTSRTLRAGRAR